MGPPGWLELHAGWGPGRSSCRAVGLWGAFLEDGVLAEGRPVGWGWPRSTSVTPREYGLGQGLLHLGKQTFILGSAEEPPGDWRVMPGPGRAGCLSEPGRQGARLGPGTRHTWGWEPLFSESQAGRGTNVLCGFQVQCSTDSAAFVCPGAIQCVSRAACFVSRGQRWPRSGVPRPRSAVGTAPSRGRQPGPSARHPLALSPRVSPSCLRSCRAWQVLQLRASASAWRYEGAPLQDPQGPGRHVLL